MKIFSMKFNPTPIQIVRRKRTIITAIRKKKYVTCNTSQFKKIDSLAIGPHISEKDSESDTLEDEDEEGSPRQGNPQWNVLPDNLIYLQCDRRHPTR